MMNSMEQTRAFLKSIGQPTGDSYNLPTSEKRFGDGDSIVLRCLEFKDRRL